jgi:hypothetical protein
MFVTYAVSYLTADICIYFVLLQLYLMDLDRVHAYWIFK